MPIYPPALPDLTSYVAMSHERNVREQQSSLNIWLTGNLQDFSQRIERLELGLVAAQDVISDLQEKLETLLSAIREEVSVIAEQAPKTLAAAAKIAIEDLKDDDAEGTGTP